MNMHATVVIIVIFWPSFNLSTSTLPEPATLSYARNISIFYISPVQAAFHKRVVPAAAIH